jgi:hypothetical protein
MAGEVPGDVSRGLYPEGGRFRPTQARLSAHRAVPQRRPRLVAPPQTQRPGRDPAGRVGRSALRYLRHVLKWAGD